MWVKFGLSVGTGKSDTTQAKGGEAMGRGGGGGQLILNYMHVHNYTLAKLHSLCSTDNGLS